MHAQNYWTKHNINKKTPFFNSEYLNHWYFSSQDRLNRLLVPRILSEEKQTTMEYPIYFSAKTTCVGRQRLTCQKPDLNYLPFGWIDLDLEILAASSFVSALEPLSVPLPLLSCDKHVPEPCESSRLGSSIDSFCRLEKNCDNLLCPGPLLCSPDELLLFIL